MKILCKYQFDGKKATQALEKNRKKKWRVDKWDKETKKKCTNGY